MNVMNKLSNRVDMIVVVVNNVYNMLSYIIPAIICFNLLIVNTPLCHKNVKKCLRNVHEDVICAIFDSLR